MIRADSPAAAEPYPLPEAMAARIRDAVAAHADRLLRLSHDLHADPEIAWQEFRSAARVARVLAREGFRVEEGAAGLDTAFVARVGPDGPTRVGLVAEYDALPGLGHACGHNVIAAAAVGAALALAPLTTELGLAVEVIGAPAEEGGGGKIPLLEAGVFDGLHAALMIHPGPDDSAWARPLAVAHFEVRYTGRTAHAGAYPWLGVNAADAFALAQVAIGLLRQQLPDGVRVHGVVTEAGAVPNAIPAVSVGNWYVRAATLEQLDAVFEQVRRCFEAGALATGCTFELNETSGRYADFLNDERLVRTFAAQSAKLGRDLRVERDEAGGMNTASTDMGNVSHRVPAIHPYLGIASAPAVNHQPAFAAAAATPAADQAILDGATALACTAAALACARIGANTTSAEGVR